MATASKSQPASEPSSPQSERASSPPEVTFRVGRVTASVFINQTNANGDEQRSRRFRSVALQRSYRDDQGNTRFVSSFGLGEIRNAIRVLELAAQHMEEKESVFTQ